MGIVREHLIAQGIAVERHDKRNAQLLQSRDDRANSRAALAGRRRPAPQSRCSCVVEQHFVLDREQLAATLGQMRFEGALVREKAIKRAIQAILVDLLVAESQQIAKRGAAIPVLGNVQLARRFAEPRRNQNCRHLRPCDAFLARRKPPLALRLKANAAPQRQIDMAKLTRALDANALQANRHVQSFGAVREKLRLFRRADQTARKRPCFKATALIELAKLRHRLLNDAPTDTNAAHQAPIAMDLPVLFANRIAKTTQPER